MELKAYYLDSLKAFDKESLDKLYNFQHHTTDSLYLINTSNEEIVDVQNASISHILNPNSQFDILLRRIYDTRYCVDKQRSHSKRENLYDKVEIESFTSLINDGIESPYDLYHKVKNYVDRVFIIYFESGSPSTALYALKYISYSFLHHVLSASKRKQSEEYYLLTINE